ncbi:hypothetical protein ACT3SZ_11405 [Corynebacterium sp. AOP40-9SA-29]|uniref:hypothetical protein n=1 Tax=Corynebacterium sp. AOP40-9SA-29 TaxID=3457677 RepID=UPI00403394CC
MTYTCPDWHLYELGTTFYSDGTSGYTDDCYSQMQSDMQASQPDLSTIPIPDGGTCPAAICGYGHDEDGNPNPSSGELQTQNGCEEGYITDPDLCAAAGRPLN